MPDEIGLEEQPGEQEQEVEQPEGEADPEPEPEVESDDGEPGGDDPHAVRARKEYRARKRLQEELQSERLQRARLEGEIQARRVAPEGKPAEETAPKYTEAEIIAWVAQNPAERSEAGVQYLKEIKKYEQAKLKRELLEEIDKTSGQREAERTATQEVDAYRRAIPKLSDKSSAEFFAAAAEYQRLTRMGVGGDSLAKEAMALRAAFGPVGKLKGRTSQPAYEREERGVPRETQGGGRRAADRTASGPEAEVRKAVHPAQIDRWKKSNKTWGEMKELVPFASDRFRL